MPDPAAVLVGRSFRVAEIGGVPTLDAPVADLTFGQDGRISGCATVNRLMGSYAVEADTLTCGSVAGTMMAGPPEAMDQEQRLHRALVGPLTVVADESGVRIELRTEDGVALVLVPDDSTALL
jgi:heat shock protein HslJ